MIGRILESHPAYGRGWRTGMAPRVVVVMPDDTKQLLTPENPYKGRKQFVSRFLWAEGMHDGSMESARRFLKGRAA